MSKSWLVHKAAKTAVQKSLAQEARDYAEQSKSENTKKAYQSQWKMWEEWARQAGLESFPAEPEAVALYLTWRIRQGRSTATLSQSLSAIRYLHTLQGLPDPTRSREVRAVWSGIRRTHGVAPRKQAAPLTPEVLVPILEEMCWGTLSVRDRALLLIGFAGGFRRSELVAVHVEDLQWSPEGLNILIRKSKGDQEGRGAKVAILPGSRRLTCPVAALRDWLRLSGVQEGPVFRGSRGRKEPLKLKDKALQPEEVTSIIRRRGRRVGLEVQLYSGHSLRSGLVTAATRAEVNDHRIMDQTRHKSPGMIRRYRREAEHMKDDFTKKLGL